MASRDSSMTLNVLYDFQDFTMLKQGAKGMIGVTKVSFQLPEIAGKKGPGACSITRRHNVRLMPCVIVGSRVENSAKSVSGLIWARAYEV